MVNCGGHLGYVIGTKIMNLVEEHPVIISTMLQFHRLSSFWQEDFQSFNQSEHIIGPGSHVGFPICTKITNLVENFPINISAKFGPNLFSGFREEDENMKSLQTRTTPSTDAKWWQRKEKKGEEREPELPLQSNSDVTSPHYFGTSVSMVTPFRILSTRQKLPHTTVNIPTMFHEVWWKKSISF